MKRRLPLVCALVGFIGLGVTAIDGAQQVQWPPDPPAPPPTYLRIDDQLFDIAGLEDPSGQFKSRPQGATIDSEFITGNMKYNGWEAGVIPIEFAPEVSQARRDQFMRICNSGWGGAAWVLCVARTSQNGFLRVTQVQDDPNQPSDCFSAVGQTQRLVQYRLNLGSDCWSDATVYHEQGHAFGFRHEHQRPDRDSYIFIDTANVRSDATGAFTKLTSLTDPLGTYDFLSIMHYRNNAFAIDRNKPTMIPRSNYGSYSGTMGTSPVPTSLDREAINKLYGNYFRTFTYTPLAATTRFNRNDFLDAMERLHAFYMSRLGLNRAAGLSLNGRPDFQGIATWIFDVYLGARSRGFSPELSFSIVVTDITQSAEWKSKHPGWTSGSRSSFTPVISFDRNEFLDALQKLDAFYSAPEGLQRPDGLSISGGPDFLGIATWVFDVYLNERLSGGSATLAWQRVVNAIRDTEEWRRKH